MFGCPFAPLSGRSILGSFAPPFRGRTCALPRPGCTLGCRNIGRWAVLLLLGIDPIAASAGFLCAPLPSLGLDWGLNFTADGTIF